MSQSKQLLIKRILRSLFVMFVVICLILWMGVQYYTCSTIFNDYMFLQRAHASTLGVVSDVHTSLITNVNGPATFLCTEKVTFWPSGSHPVTFSSVGADTTLTVVDENCNEDAVLVLYNPQRPTDARVANVVHAELAKNLIEETIFGVFTLLLIVSGLGALIEVVSKRRKKHCGSTKG